MGSSSRRPRAPTISVSTSPFHTLLAPHSTLTELSPQMGVRQSAIFSTTLNKWEQATINNMRQHVNVVAYPKQGTMVTADPSASEPELPNRGLWCLTFQSMVRLGLVCTGSNTPRPEASSKGASVNHRML